MDPNEKEAVDDTAEDEDEAEAQDGAGTEGTSDEGQDDAGAGEDGAGEGGSEGEGEPEEGSGTTAPTNDEKLTAAIVRAEAATARADEAERRWRQEESLKNSKLTDEQRQAKLAAMTPEERINFIADEASARVDHARQFAEFQSKDTADRSEFLARIADKPQLFALKDVVESRLNDLKKQGQYVTREVMMKFVLGEKAYSAVMKGKGGKQKKAAAERVTRATTQASPARGSVNGTGSAGGKGSARERLANVVF